MDYKKMTCELIRVLRDDLSQSFVNKKLSYDYNQISRWEQGRNQISWDDFLLLLEVYGVDLKPIFYKHYRYPGEIRDFAGILDFIFSNASISDVSSDLKIARSTIYSWKKNERTPPLYQMFRLFNYYYLNIESFLNDLLQGKKLFATETVHQSKQNLSQLAFKYPMIIAAALCFDLADYQKLSKHQKGFMADKICIDQDEEDFYIELLAEHGLLIEEQGKYRVDTRHFVLEGGTREQLGIRVFWHQQAIERAEAFDILDGTKRTFPYSFTIFAGNTELYKNLMKRYLDFHHEINAMAVKFEEEHKESLEGIYCLNMSLFGLSTDFARFGRASIEPDQKK